MKFNAPTGQQSQFLKNTQQQTQTMQQPLSAAREFNFSFAERDQLEETLRKPRSRAYMEIFDAVDLLSETDEEIIAALMEKVDPDTAEEFREMSVEELLEEIRASIQEEFLGATIELEQVMHGILSKCYIEGCDCHAISPEGDFLAHYKADGPIPEELSKGRALFERFPDCRCIEVYQDCCRVVMQDSSVVKVKNNEI